jgi:hypothetical protein
MKFFIDFINEDQSLRKLLSMLTEMHGHQGTVIRFSDSFFTLYGLQNKYPPKYIEELFYSYYDFYRHFYREFPNNFFNQFPFQDYSEDCVPSSFSYSDYHRFKQKLPPFLKDLNFKPLEIVISIFNDAEIEIFDKLIYEYRSNEDYRLVIEKRGRNTFLNSKKSYDPLVGGISIGIESANIFGTLGGFLKDKNNKRYGLTCSHVVLNDTATVIQPSKFDSNNYRNIGKALVASKLELCEANSACNPAISKGNMDAAIFEINDAEKCEFRINELGKVNGVKNFNEIIQGMKVEFNGRSTNRRKQLAIGGLCVSYKVAYDQASTVKYACFTDLIELRSTPKKFLWMNFDPQGSPVLSGDSGAWICSNESTGYTWCGMLISGDVDRGYFLSATHILKWLEKSGYLFEI